MFKNKYLISLIISLCFGAIYAQSSVSGTVLDVQNTPVYGANVLLKDTSTNKIVKGSITDENGIFEIELFENQSYSLTISMIGFESYETLIQADNTSPNQNLGSITLQEGTELDEVVIKAQKPLFEQKIDRVVVNVKENATTAGGTVLEVLEKSPGIIVNRESNDISMNGKEGVLVMINGKVSRQPTNSLMQMLKNISAESIGKVELISNPSAKYDAASNAGIISIDLVKGENLGTNGSFSVTGGHGEFEKSALGINMNHRKGKTNLYYDANYRRDKSFVNISVFRETFSDNLIETSSSKSERFSLNNNVRGKVGLDYQFSEKSILGIFVTGYIDRWEVDAPTTGFDSNSIGSRTDYTGINEDIFEQLHGVSNINFNHTFKNESNLNFDIDYLYHKNNNPSDVSYTFIDQNTNAERQEFISIEKNTPINIWATSLDYSFTLDKLTFETGVKGVNSNFQNDVIFDNIIGGVPVRDDELSDNSELNEQIGAVYTSFIYKNEKNRIEIGGRYEYSETNLDTPEGRDNVSLIYNNFFPNLSYSRNLGKSTTLSIAYNKKIQRPTFTDLAPYFVFINPNTFYFGNTALTAALNDDISAKLIYKKYSVLFSYNYGDNTIVTTQPSLDEDTNEQILIPINLDFSKTYSMNVAVPIKITTWWNFDVNFLGIAKEVKPMNDGEGKQSYYRISGAHSFKLPKDMSIDISGFYQSKALLGITQVKPFGDFSVGVKKKFSPTSSLSLNLNNITGYKFTRLSDNSLNDQNFSSDYGYFNEPRIFRLTYAYSFGNNKLKSKRKRNSASEDIKNRI